MFKFLIAENENSAASMFINVKYNDMPIIKKQLVSR